MYLIPSPNTITLTHPLRKILGKKPQRGVRAHLAGARRIHYCMAPAILDTPARSVAPLSGEDAIVVRKLVLHKYYKLAQIVQAMCRRTDRHTFTRYQGKIYQSHRAMVRGSCGPSLTKPTRAKKTSNKTLRA